VHEELIGRLRVAAEAFDDGDPEPLVALLHPDLEWRGVGRGHLWWKRTPT
jgi:ketosteroid isomerase-like protein